MTTVYHLIVSQHELDLISGAARSLYRLTELGTIFGASADDVREQAKLLHLIEQRLFRSSDGIQLTSESQAESA